MTPKVRINQDKSIELQRLLAKLNIPTDSESVKIELPDETCKQFLFILVT
jgi:hypothetical protein